MEWRLLRVVEWGSQGEPLRGVQRVRLSAGIVYCPRHWRCARVGMAPQLGLGHSVGDVVAAALEFPTFHSGEYFQCSS